MKVTIPDFCLVAVVSPDPVGTEAVTAAFAREEVAGGSREPWPEFAARRLGARQLALVDASALSTGHRVGLVRLAKRFHPTRRNTSAPSARKKSASY